MNRHIIHILAAMIAMAAATALSDAAPARRGPITLRQPDGYSFTAVLRGDEFGHILKTMDGCAIIQDEDGYYCYAVFDADGSRHSSGVRVGADTPGDVLAASRQIPYGQIAALAAANRMAVQNLGEEPLTRRIMKAQGMMSDDGTPLTRSDGSLSNTIEKHGLVILAQFSDVPFTYTREDFIRMLTQSRYSVNGATGSALDYFNDQFGGAWEFSFDVSDIVTLSHNRAYYGGNDKDGNDMRPAQMVKDACELADSMIDFSAYDDDGDGEADNVFVFFAGGDEAEVAGDDCIWSHAWYVKDGAGIDLTLDGVRINRYACTAELTRMMTGDYTIAGIGTFCHEYSHTFGLPDFYDTDYEGSGTMIAAGLWGSTSLMDSGNQNNGGNTPPNYNAIEREILELSEPELLSAGNYTLSPVSESSRYLRIDSGTENEYYLIECRSDEGWDAHIGGSGLLIYHIDKSVNTIDSDLYERRTTARSRWDVYNEVNANPDHQCADLVEADGREDKVSSRGYINGSPGIFFPAGSTEFTASGTPAFRFWDGSVSALSISGISIDYAGNVSFSVSSSDNFTPEASEVTARERYQNAVILTWGSNSATNDPAYVTYEGLDGEIEVKPYKTGRYSTVIEGLEPNTDYTMSVYFKTADGTPWTKTSCTFKTRALPENNAYPYIILPAEYRDSNGRYQEGAKIPLLVMNAVEAESVTWTFGGQTITREADGYYTLRSGGYLKAEITYPDGSTDIIIRTISIR